MRLSESKIAELRNKLTEWQSPASMAELVSNTNDELGSADFFGQAGLQLLRDAWIAAKFGQLRSATEVRLIKSEWPDFELRIDGNTESYESVEADDPDRRRGDEYKNSDGGIEEDPVEEWIKRAEAAPLWLAAACRKKVNKNYSEKTNLVVYLNLSEYGIRQAEVEACFADSTELAKDKFESVWVLWKDVSYLVWENGHLAKK